MQLKTDALIIRENNRIGESDRFITALTRDRGVIHASARGARKVSSRNGSGTALLTYTTLTLTEGKSKWIVTDAKPQHVFFELRADMKKLALAQYFCELAGVLAPRDEPADACLRLLLNALSFLSGDERDPALIKAVVEQRLLLEAGYRPDLDACRACGKQDGGMFLQTLSGSVLCAEHARGEGIPLPAGAVAAWRWLLEAPAEKVFSFRLSPESLVPLEQASERFLLACLGRGFNTLDFYNTVR
ncbi:MAG: DNA repair protein RecO [Clostridia bacterium]|nr:DNA repair protein RecO [Clostridia bacterium]